MFYVYYDEPRSGAILGSASGAEFVTLKINQSDKKLLVSVKEGSLVPKDDLVKREEALTLWSQNAIDPITLFERLQFPDPQESAKQLFLWQTNPISLFPELAQQAQAPEQPAELPQQTPEAPPAPQVPPETFTQPLQ